MTKQEYLKTQRGLVELKWQAYDDKNYERADAIQAEIEALVDPEPDDLLTGDEGLLIFLGDIGSYEEVERKHSWMRKTY